VTGPGIRPAVVPIVVVGGGIAGLVVALDLARAGLRPLVLESADNPGGVVTSHSVGGLTLDAGAESFATARPAVTDLLTELGLADRIAAPNPVGAWVRHRSGAAPLPATAFLGIPGRPWAADVRRVIGLPGALRCAVDAVLPVRRSGLPAGLTVGALVRSRMGARVLDRLVEPVAGGVYAADPDVLEVRTIAPGLDKALLAAGSLAGAARRLRAGGERSGSAVATLTGGLHTMVGPLVDAVRDAGGVVCTGSTVARIERIQGGWQVALSAGDPIQAATVVLAVSAPRAAALLASSVPSAPASVLTAPITPVLICTLVVRDDRLDRTPRGTGVLVSARTHGVRAKALTHATAKWPWLAETAGPATHVLRLSYGRGEELPVAGELPGLALADASDLLGVALRPAAVVDVAVVTWTSALPAPRPGHADDVRALRADLQPRGLWVVGASVAGSGLAAVVGDARTQTTAMIKQLNAVSSIAPAAENPARG
jgi:protoporphyrinogen/coproporphyrinogen III oxidase